MAEASPREDRPAGSPLTRSQARRRREEHRDEILANSENMSRPDQGAVPRPADAASQPSELPSRSQVHDAQKKVPDAPKPQQKKIAKTKERTAPAYVAEISPVPPAPPSRVAAVRAAGARCLRLLLWAVVALTVSSVVHQLWNIQHSVTNLTGVVRALSQRLDDVAGQMSQVSSRLDTAVEDAEGGLTQVEEITRALVARTPLIDGRVAPPTAREVHPPSMAVVAHSPARPLRSTTVAEMLLMRVRGLFSAAPLAGPATRALVAAPRSPSHAWIAFLGPKATVTVAGCGSDCRDIEAVAVDSTAPSSPGSPLHLLGPAAVRVLARAGPERNWTELGSFQYDPNGLPCQGTSLRDRTGVLRREGVEIQVQMEPREGAHSVALSGIRFLAGVSPGPKHS